MENSISTHRDDDEAFPVAIPYEEPYRTPPGIYFGMPENVYHADPALGSGSVRSLAKNAMYFWQDSWMNPLRPVDEETPALLYGRALHSLVLEGPEKFTRSYAPYPRKADHPNALDTAKDIQAVLRGLGQKTSGTKPDLMERLRAADPSAELWDDIVSKFERDAAKNGATVLKADVFERVVTAARFIAAEERVAAAFSKGMSEVSVFWVVDGVPLKARLDYVRLGMDGARPIGLITDLKSFANKYEKAPERAVIDAIVQTRLDIQTALYLQGAALIPQFIKDGRAYGTDGVSKEWLAALAKLEPNDWRWFWCFYEKEAPIAMLRSTRPASTIIRSATAELERALQTYRDHMAAFGTQWRFVDPIQDTELDPSDLPRFFGA
jgi:hypothetical protein